ncbi:MAG: DUF1569 domain-containing protein [Bacteroidetes bacterium]|nr:DUF1569 domain-containing protein [Bacteroidota bacterium]
MPLPNIFTKEVSEAIIDRLNKLTPDSKPLWGKMGPAQMMAHCNVAYEMVYDNIHREPNAVLKFILKALVKNKVVGEKPFPHNSKTAPEFIIRDSKDFDKEKKRLIDYINRTQELGESGFDGKVSNSFGPLTKTEWNNLFYKHLDHHLSQFGI